MTPVNRIPLPSSAGPARPRPRLVGAAGALAAILVVAGGALAALWSATSSDRSAPAVVNGRALVDARAFLNRYVDPSGRVVRRDQGGDTVSEGQAYGLLLSQAIGDQAEFQRIWSWTRAHLQLLDGELASETSPSGAVQDRTPASDADVLAAWALSRASGPDAGTDRAQARRMAEAILGNETVSRGGRPLLTAGPWANGSPATLDPSYWAIPAVAGLGRFSGDAAWSRLATDAHRATASLTRDGAVLPPDWARLRGTLVSPASPPGYHAPSVQYGLDAQRLVIWLAVSCNPSDRRLAARWWRILARPGRSSAIALSPAGRRLSSSTNALPLVAGAAAAGAAGDRSAQARLLDQARAEQGRYPTYYGSAWLALGEVLLRTTQLGACGRAGGSG